mmetsp:Transcript_70475/g.187397  ORF Transcript_70475/g.187397 Transcript_70475/m.187397 type:complete len:200 (+) Transcript_70475:286-885(+)
MFALVGLGWFPVLIHEQRLEFTIACPRELAGPLLTALQLEELLAICAYLVVHAHLQVKYVICRVPVDAANRLLLRDPAAAFTQRLPCRAIWVQRIWCARKDHRARGLPRKRSHGGTYLPFQIPANIVWHAVAIETEDVEIRDNTIPGVPVLPIILTQVELLLTVGVNALIKAEEGGSIARKVWQSRRITQLAGVALIPV